MKQQFIVDEKGRKTAVVLPIKEYERLLEDMHDLEVVAGRRDEPTVSLREVRENLRGLQMDLQR